MHRFIVLAIALLPLLLPAGAPALTTQEEELLRRAGVSEERIQEMKSGQKDAAGPGPAAVSETPKQEAPVVVKDEAAAPAAVAPEASGGQAVPASDFTDWNGDGVKDIIAGTNNGELLVYINKGTNAHPDFEDAEEVEDGDVDSGAVSVPCIVDWDNDGLKDVLMGNRGGTVYLYINSGTNKKPVFRREEELMGGDLDVGGYSAPTVVDWDGDGKKDLVVGDFNGRLNVFINIGADESPRFDDEPEELRAEMFTYSTFNYTTPFAVKNHDNGLFDIITGCGDGRIYRFRNSGMKGSPKFVTPQHIMVNDFIYEVNGNSNVIAVDWDGDGVEDLLVSNRTTKQTQGTSSTEAVSQTMGVKKVPSKVYLLKNVGTNKAPRYDRPTGILKDYVDINL